MKKNDLIQKWLDHNLNEEELAAFKKLDAYSSLRQIDHAAQAYKAPQFDANSAYLKLQETIQTAPKKRFLKYWLGVAAILVVALGVSLSVFKSDIVSHSALAAVQENIILPDASKITLLPNSEIQFDQKEWNETRAISLNGAAYFDVEKGNSFTVQTEHGLVTVLGTEFSVKDWGSYFEVTCYEGSVRVEGYNKSEVLSPGMQFTAIHSDVSIREEIAPWSAQTTKFNDVPLSTVLEFIERNYAVSIHNTANAKGSFTGSVNHENLKEALLTISIPFQLSFEIKNATIILKSK